MIRTCLSLCAALFLLVSAPLPSSAVFPDLTWEQDVEVVDSPVPSLPAASSSMAALADGVLHVVYLKSGTVYHRARTAEGWLAPEPLSAPGIPAVEPHITSGPGIHVIWADSRTGQSEIWTRRLSGSTWLPEECLSAGSVASSRPALTSESGTALLVWQDSGAGITWLTGRLLLGSTWGAAFSVTSGPGNATEPAVSGDPGSGMYGIAWTDSRHGLSEIYCRFLAHNGSWRSPEIRVTDFPGACRNPSVEVETCCGDYIDQELTVSFETESGGVSEVWSGCCWPEGGVEEIRRLSDDDGISSVAPSQTGFPYLVDYPLMGGWSPRHFLTWTDVTATGRRHVLLENSACQENFREVLTESGRSSSAVVTFGGQPTASLAAFWIEEREGVQTLLVRRGTLPGCSSVEFVTRGSVLLAPEGIPPLTIQLRNACSGLPLQGMIGLQFTPELDHALTWHPQQPHPSIPDQYTNPEGRVNFAIRGGGCSPQGFAYVRSQGIYWWGFTGAKSPDVDGNCAVRQDDLDYVESRLGSDDFCADLDDSGFVDSLDVAIVLATFGDLCSHLVDVDPVDPAMAGIPSPSLRISPNPCRDHAVLALSLPGRATGTEGARIHVMDVAGRLVRELEIAPGARDAVLVWDTRDSSGRLVPAGFYWAALRGAGFRAERAVLVIR